MSESTPPVSAVYSEGPTRPRGVSRGFCLSLVLIFCVTCGVIVRDDPSNPEDQHHMCLAVQRKTQKVVEDFAQDHEGRYPTALSELVPDYLDTAPVCPNPARRNKLEYTSAGVRATVGCDDHGPRLER